MPRLLRRLGWLTLALVALWLGALGWFLATSLLSRADPGATTDAIVVLTGGRMRLETGLALLAAGRARKLFVSGVNQRVDREELLHAVGLPAEATECCIVLGHAADNTVGNAHETALWMRQEGYRSLRLVTSWYHLERGLLEFRRAMPDLTILPHPVFASHGDPDRWWGRHGAAMVILREYHKYLAARLRPLMETALPSRFVPTP